MTSFVVAQISDTHLRREPSDDVFGPDATLERTVEALQAHRPDAVVLTGDIADDGSVEACRRAQTVIERLGVPILATPGNHDDADAVRAVFGPKSVLHHETSWAGGVTRWHILAADTVLPQKEHGRIDVAALLKRIDAIDGSPTIVALHHPPISRSQHPWFQLEGGPALVAALTRRPHVKAVVSGHLHEAFDVHLGGVSYIGCPSSWYGIAHQGNTWVENKMGLVGAHVFHLSHDHTFTFTPVRRPI